MKVVMMMMGSCAMVMYDMYGEGCHGMDEDGDVTAQALPPIWTHLSLLLPVGKRPGENKV